MRIRLAVQALSVVLLTAALASGCAGDGGESTAGSIETVVDDTVPTSTPDLDDTLPPLPVAATEVRSWLAAEGAAFAQVRRVATEVVAVEDDLPPADCVAWVEVLGSGPDPQELVEAAATAPDPVLGNGLAATVVELNRVLSGCASGQQPTESLEQLRAQLALIEEREAAL